MKLEDQVCSLKLSKRLKELGVRQESAFYWVGSPNAQYTTKLFKAPVDWQGKYTLDDYWIVGHYFSAFTVAELGEILPTKCWTQKFDGANPGENCFWNCYKYFESPSHMKQTADTEANARAAMLCYLIEKGIVKP